MKSDKIKIVLLLLFSSLLIFFRFTQIPKYLAYDEVEFTKLALSLEGKSYVPYSPLATGHSTLYFYIILLSLKTFGINTFALRLPAAIFGVLSVIVFYLIMKIIFSKESNQTSIFKFPNSLLFPTLLTSIFLTSRWFINFSRFAFEPTFLLFLELTSIYFLLSDKSLFISGLFAGLAFNSYTPGRIFFLLPLGFLTLKLVNPLTRKQSNNETIKQLLLFIIPFIILATPLTIYLFSHKDARINQQFFLRNSEMTIGEKASGLWQNISSTTLMFFTKGDMNGRHNYPGKPAINPILGVLGLLGILGVFKNYKKFYSLFFLCYFFLSLFPALMTYPWENPNMLRTFTVIPSVVYFVGQGIVTILNLSHNFKFQKKFVIAMILFVVFLSSLYELRTYFKYQAKVFESSFEIQYPLEKAIKLKNPYEKNL